MLFMNPESITGSLIVPFLISYQTSSSKESLTLALNVTNQPTISSSCGVTIEILGAEVSIVKLMLVSPKLPAVSFAQVLR